MADPNKLFWCGELGKGATAKIVNNYLSGTILLANCEAMALGVKSGLDPKLLYRVVTNSTGQSFMFSNVNPVPGLSPDAPASHDYRGGFREPMMIKDMTLAIEAAKAARVKPSLAEAAVEVYREASMDPYCAERDATVLYHWLVKE
jgi:3-hydroxyisobutyrate dehydrogenase